MNYRKNICVVWTALLILASCFTCIDAAENPYPADWFWGEEEDRKAHDDLIGKPMPMLEISDWMNGSVSRSDMKGSILVVDFWATWCGPCIGSIPHNNEIQKKYADNGVKVIGVCGSRNGQDAMADVVRQYGIEYSVGKDATLKSAPAWKVSFFPTYAVVDRKGIVRAVGMMPAYIEPIIDSLLKEEKLPASSLSKERFTTQVERDVKPNEGTFEMGGSSSGSPMIDAALLEGDRSRFASLEGKPAPSISSGKNWLNSEAMDISDLKGKIVVLDFWATWCGPCLRAVPHTNAMAEKYADDVVIIGICHPQGMEKMQETAETHGMKYALVADADGAIKSSYRVDGFPDYYVIDRDGTLIAADCKNNSVEAVIETLLAK